MAYLNELTVGKLTVEQNIATPANPNAAATSPTAKNQVILVGPIKANRTTTGTQVMLTIPSGMTVTSVVHQTIVASNAATSHSNAVGDATTADGWDTAVDQKATAGTKVTGDGAYATAANIAASMGKLYATATDLIVTETITGACSAGTYRLIAYGYFA